MNKTYPTTTEWFKGLAPAERKAILTLMHDMRIWMGEQGRSILAERMFCALLRCLEEDHDKAEVTPP